MAGTSHDMSDLFEATPPEVAEIAKNNINDLLPTKSKERYELAYEKFNNYKTKFVLLRPLKIF